MNVIDFFSENTSGETSSPSGFFENLRKDTNSDVELNHFDLIFMTANIPFADKVRTSIHSLSNHFTHIKSADLGKTLNNDFRFLLQPVQSCLDQNKTSIFLGGNEELLNLLTDKGSRNITYISNALPRPDQISENQKFLAYQRHLCDYKSLKYADEFCPDSLSLGQMKSHPHLIEPILRDTEILYLNLNAIRSSEVPGMNSAWPSGLITEELCQIAKFAGHSLRLKSVIIDCGDLAQTENEQGAKLVAELYWYLLEGLKMKQSDHPSLNNNISEYVVNIAEFDTELVFVKSNITHRWWLKLEENQNNVFLSCAQEEYQQTIQSEVPERLLRHIL